MYSGQRIKLHHFCLLSNLNVFLKCGRFIYADWPKVLRNFWSDKVIFMLQMESGSFALLILAFVLSFSFLYLWIELPKDDNAFDRWVSSQLCFNDVDCLDHCGRGSAFSLTIHNWLATPPLSLLSLSTYQSGLYLSPEGRIFTFCSYSNLSSKESDFWPSIFHLLSIAGLTTI